VNEESHERSTDANEFLTGFLTGALVGGALAIFLTPQSGEDLRHMFRAGWRRTTNRARDLAGDLGGADPLASLDQS